MKNMEVHLVHQALDGSLLVIGVLIDQGSAANEGFAKILAKAGSHEEISLNPIEMIPRADDMSALKFYTYRGSLTTPPCTPRNEDIPRVTWVVLRDHITISRDQFKKYEGLDGGKYKGTSRYPQPTITTLTVERNFKP